VVAQLRKMLRLWPTTEKRQLTAAFMTSVTQVLLSLPDGP